MISKTPKPPYYVVIFSSERTDGDNGYGEMASRMTELARLQPGFLGIESAREALGITVSYWKNLESIRLWRDQADHVVARKLGREKWYKSYKIRIALVEQDYGFNKD